MPVIFQTKINASEVTNINDFVGIFVMNVKEHLYVIIVVWFCHFIHFSNIDKVFEVLKQNLCYFVYQINIMWYNK